MPDPYLCPHLNFSAKCVVNRLPAEGQWHNFLAANYVAEVRVKCTDCGVHFRFLGLPAGVNLAAASVSADGQELRAAIKPVHLEAHDFVSVN